jgi:hypothetical protein
MSQEVLNQLLLRGLEHLEGATAESQQIFHRASTNLACFRLL